MFKLFSAKLFNDYLFISADTLRLGVCAGIISSLMCLIYIGFKCTTLFWIVAVFGVFINALILTIALPLGRLVQVRYGLVVGLCATVTTILGSCLGYSGWWTSLGIIFLIPFVALTCYSTALINISVLFIVDMFVIGSGIQADFRTALSYGIAFFLGAMLIVGVNYWSSRFSEIYFDENPDHVHFNFKLMFRGYKFSFNFCWLLTLAVLIANGFSYVFKLPEGYWIPMTALLILRADYASSQARIKHRLWGTILGSVVASCLIVFINNSILLAFVMLPVMTFIVIALARHYGSYVFFLTIMITVMFNLTDQYSYLITEHRLFDTLLGIIIVLAVLWLIHPLITKVANLDRYESSSPSGE